MKDLKIIEKLLPGVSLFECAHYPDTRGSFTKIFHFDSLQKSGIGFSPAESFITKSSADVLRGMHFQTGEAAHDKLVYCIKGSVLDVIVDVRPDSELFNKPVSVELNENTPMAVLIGKGYAHGFLSLENDSWMHYTTSTTHCPELDRGVRWDSIDFRWPIQNPILSQRDKAHPSIHSWQ